MGASQSGPDFRRRAFQPTTADDPAAVSGHRVGARLGTSAVGRVYLAYAPGGQPVALTVVHPELAAAEGFAARFHRDAQVAGRIQAPGVLPVLGSGQEGGRYWIATAYVPALPLDAVIDGQGPLPTGLVLRLVAGLAETLRSLHHAGVVHGDLRPPHVLLAPDGPKLTGYGLAGVADPAADAREDRQGPAFLAPEQVAGKPAVPATDVFALGQVAAYASIGRPPFADPARVLQDEPDLNELPGELREIVTRCLIKEPGLRPSLAQVTAMCAQAAPAAAPRPGAWLPPALLAAIPSPHAPAAGVGGPAAPGTAAPAGPPPAPGTPSAPPGPPVPSAQPASPTGPTPFPDRPLTPPVAGGVTGPGVPGAPEARSASPAPAAPPTPLAGPTPVPARPLLPPVAGAAGSGAQGAPGGLPTVPGPSVPPPGAIPGPALPPGLVGPPGPSVPPPGAIPGPALPPGPAGAPGPRGPQPLGVHHAAGAAHAAGGGGGLPAGLVAVPPGPGYAAPVHPVPMPHGGHGGHGAIAARPRRRTTGVLAVGVIAALVAGVTLVWAFTGSDDTRGRDFGATAPAAAPSGPPSPVPSTPPTPSSTPPSAPVPGDTYDGLRLPAGSAVVLQDDPPFVHPDLTGGAFGLTQRGDAFFTEPHQAWLSVLDPGLPSTSDSCRVATGPQRTSVPRQSLAEGSGRMCVHMIDGTLALVTLRQFSPPADPQQFAVIDVTVWRVVDQSAESDL